MVNLVQSTLWEPKILQNQKRPRVVGPGSGSLFPSLLLLLPCPSCPGVAPHFHRARSKLWEAGKWDIEKYLCSWILLCVWDCAGRAGWREGIPHAVNNPDQFAPQPLSCNLFIMLCIFITRSSIALVQTRLQSACQRIFFKHQSLWKKNWSATLNAPLKSKPPSISLAGRQCASLVLSKGDLLPLNYSGPRSSVGIHSKTHQ